MVRKIRGHITPFINILQDLSPSISFTSNSSTDALTFLDVIVEKINGKLETNLYHKPTDSRSYVPFNSAHPKHILVNIPFSLANRVHRLVSTPDNRDKELKELEVILKNLNYPPNIINQGFQRAANNVVSPSSITNSQSRKKPLHFVTTFNKNNPNVFNPVISPIFNTLKLNEPFLSYKLIKSFRQPSSLLRLLNRNDKRTIKGVTKCNEPQCVSCDTLCTGKEITFLQNNFNKTFHIKDNLNCLSINVIYALWCLGCDKYYIGQTGDMFRKRLTLHRQHIYQPQYAILNVSKHITRCCMNRELKFKASPILSLPPWYNKGQRERKEKDLISLLRPELNSI